MSALGAVVGATKGDAMADLRALMPDQVFLMPGIGAQGAGVGDVRAAVRAGARTLGGAGVLPTASRSVIYPEGADGLGSEDWGLKIKAAASDLAAASSELIERE